MGTFNHISYNEDGSLKVKVHCVTFKEGDFYISILPALKLTARSKQSPEDSINHMNNVMAMFCKINSDKNKMHNELTRLGWTNNQPPEIKFSENVLDNEPTFTPMELSI